MKGMFWIDGRLRWPLVVGVAYVSISILAMDIAWRTLTVSAEALFIYGTITFLAGALVLAGLSAIFRGRSRSNSR